ncbi:dephospho-CoA kinase [Microbacterium sp. ASV49]|uniref:Dephospho-CoA kinase n=1 Tax=Microbacterium candidum TaxID=3041922 RepID=A0ABT7MXY7_9MICO|nr:dephospho-CoA kinase [Microbacterium sp. ASV49]MDL9979301.1 dephospho-CoA kinase [Microbacterium sp. ASV49]
MPLRLIALTGGIGAGKSTVARMLTDRGARLIDADELARRVVDPADDRGRAVLAAIAARFGDDLIAPDGTLDRARTADRVFSDPDARAAYNAIVHPALRKATVDAIETLRTAQDDGVVAHEIPLLTADTGSLPWTYDLVVTVEAAAEVRADRLVSGRGYSPEHAWARIVAQGDETARIAIADVVLRTDGDRADTARSVTELWSRLHSVTG